MITLCLQQFATARRYRVNSFGIEKINFPSPQNMRKHGQRDKPLCLPSRVWLRRDNKSLQDSSQSNVIAIRYVMGKETATHEESFIWDGKAGTGNLSRSGSCRLSVHLVTLTKKKLKQN